MTTIKSYTDIEQSRKLAKILPRESADMYYEWPNKKVHFKDDKYSGMGLSCWSLASLLEQLPYEVVDDDGNSVYLQMNKEDDVYQLAYIDTYGFTENIYTDIHEHFVDACVAMIELLHELKIL